MKEMIERRELFVLDNLEVVLRGTYHKVGDESPCADRNPIEPDRVGFLFLAGLSATRASNGDVAVYWADLFAEHGYPSFRLDLPGFGDSAGDPPAEQLAFINRGGFASIVSAAIKELTTRFNLSGVVIVGHCSGTVSAIYAAAATERCKGLILMDPFFHLPQTKGLKIRRQLHVFALQSRLDGFLHRIHDFSKEISLRLRGNRTPDNANTPLLRCWKEIGSSGLPILVLMMPPRKTSGGKAATGEFDYIQYALELAGNNNRVLVKVAEGANHSFANRLGRAAVRQHTKNWLSDHFPLAEHKESEVHALHAESVVAK